MMLAEFDHEMANTRKTLARIPADQLEFRPHEKSMTAIKLAGHIAEMLGWLPAVIQTPELDMAGWQAPPPPTNIAEVLAMFDQSLPAARAALAEATDEQMAANWTIRNGETVFLSMPRAAMIRGMVLNHLVHHRAQLSVYLRMVNVPVPALYGPSADEQQ